MFVSHQQSSIYTYLSVIAITRELQLQGGDKLMGSPDLCHIIVNSSVNQLKKIMGIVTVQY